MMDYEAMRLFAESYARKSAWGGAQDCTAACTSATTVGSSTTSNTWQDIIYRYDATTNTVGARCWPLGGNAWEMAYNVVWSPSGNPVAHVKEKKKPDVPKINEKELAEVVL